MKRILAALGIHRVYIDRPEPGQLIYGVVSFPEDSPLSRSTYIGFHRFIIVIEFGT